MCGGMSRCVSVYSPACEPTFIKKINRKRRNTVEKRLVAGRPSLFSHSFGFSGGMMVKMSLITLFFSLSFFKLIFSSRSMTSAFFCSAIIIPECTFQLLPSFDRNQALNEFIFSSSLDTLKYFVIFRSKSQFVHTNDRKQSGKTSYKIVFKFFRPFFFIC